MWWWEDLDWLDGMSLKGKLLYYRESQQSLTMRLWCSATGCLNYTGAPIIGLFSTAFLSSLLWEDMLNACIFWVKLVLAGLCMARKAYHSEAFSFGVETLGLSYFMTYSWNSRANELMWICTFAYITWKIIRLRRKGELLNSFSCWGFLFNASSTVSVSSNLVEIWE